MKKKCMNGSKIKRPKYEMGGPVQAMPGQEQQAPAQGGGQQMSPEDMAKIKQMYDALPPEVQQQIMAMTDPQQQIQAIIQAYQQMQSGGQPQGGGGSPQPAAPPDGSMQQMRSGGTVYGYFPTSESKKKNIARYNNGGDVPLDEGVGKKKKRNPLIVYTLRGDFTTLRDSEGMPETTGGKSYQIPRVNGIPIFVPQVNTNNSPEAKLSQFVAAPSSNPQSDTQPVTQQQPASSPLATSSDVPKKAGTLERPSLDNNRKRSNFFYGMEALYGVAKWGDNFSQPDPPQLTMDRTYLKRVKFDRSPINQQGADIKSMATATMENIRRSTGQGADIIAGSSAVQSNANRAMNENKANLSNLNNQEEQANQQIAATEATNNANVINQERQTNYQINAQAAAQKRQALQGTEDFLNQNLKNATETANKADAMDAQSKIAFDAANNKENIDRMALGLQMQQHYFPLIQEKSNELFGKEYDAQYTKLANEKYGIQAANMGDLTAKINQAKTDYQTFLGTLYDNPDFQAAVKAKTDAGVDSETATREVLAKYTSDAKQDGNYKMATDTELAAAGQQILLQLSNRKGDFTKQARDLVVPENFRQYLLSD